MSLIHQKQYFRRKLNRSFMKPIISTAFLSFITLITFSQTTIEGTYLPVKNTRILQVWDTAATTMPIPTSGASQIWDYSNGFSSIMDTFELAVKDPLATPHAMHFPNATHASFLRSPFALADSLWLYFTVDTVGLRNLGYYSDKASSPGLVTADPTEFVLPMALDYQDTLIDYSRYEGLLTYSGTPVKVVRTMLKTMIASGYGTLHTPDASYSDVMLGKEVINQIDSIFIDLGAGNYAFFSANDDTTHRFHFLRNNTFASTHIMQINTNASETNVSYGWYTLPVDFGSIEGTVFDTTGFPVTIGEMYLYRENSNFTKNDILATTTINNNGTYQFDSIPYGEYRIAARPDLASYPHVFTTYYGDTTDWVNCQTAITSGDTTGIDINILYGDAQTGSSTLEGNLSLNTWLKNNDPVPGIDIIVERDPEEEPVVETNTDIFGEFSFPALDDGDYKIWVDMPGLPMAGTYSFTVANGTVVSDLNFEVGADEIFPTSMVITSINESISNQPGRVNVYPNPFAENTILNIDTESETKISIDVYDITGKLIDQLVHNQLNTGSANYTINGLNDAGIYLVKVTLGESVECLRIVKK